MIRFYEESTGDEVGTLDLVDGALRASGIGESIAGGVIARTSPPEKAIAFYSDWSNGYLRGKADPELGG